MRSASEKFATAKARLELGGPWPGPMIRDIAWNKARMSLEIAKKALLNQTQRNGFRHEREADWDRIHEAWQGVRDFNLLALSNVEVLDAVVNEPHCFACTSMRNRLTEGSELPSRQIYNFKISQHDGLQWMAWYTATAWWKQAKTIAPNIQKVLQCQPQIREGIKSAERIRSGPEISGLDEVQENRVAALDGSRDSKPQPILNQKKT